MQKNTHIPFVDEVIDNIERRFVDCNIMHGFNIIFNPDSYSVCDPDVEKTAQKKKLSEGLELLSQRLGISTEKVSCPHQPSQYKLCPLT